MSRRGKRITILSVLLLAILLSVMLFPTSVRVCYEDVAMEYSLTEPDMAIAHEISIDGYYYSSILGKDRFRGSFYISDVKGLTRETNNAHFSFDPRYRYSPAFLNAYGEPRGTEISTLFFDKNFQHLAVQFAYIYTMGEGLTKASTSDHLSTFLVVGAASREDAISQYTRLLDEKSFS